MHLHSVLMVAAVGIIWAFAIAVVVVTWLQRRGRLGPPDARLSFLGYGPILAGAASGGAAAAHLVTVAGHARDLPTKDGAVAFICSIGAGAHFQTLDAGVAGYLPLGVLSIGLVIAQVVWTAPRLWQDPQLAVVGASVAVISIVAAIDRVTFRAPSAATAGTDGLGYADVLALVLEAMTVALVGLLVAQRPRRVFDRLTVKAPDAWIATSLGVSTVITFTVVAVVVGNPTH